MKELPYEKRHRHHLPDPCRVSWKCGDGYQEGAGKDAGAFRVCGVTSFHRENLDCGIDSTLTKEWV
jgi:hypothetical protein